MGILKGKVKFFDAEKGYGIVCNLENMLDEYKINASNIVGYDFPKRGDTVSFIGKENIKNGKKGIALRVKIEKELPNLNINKIKNQDLQITQGQKKGDFVLNSNVDIEDIKRRANPNDPRTKCPHCDCLAVHRVYRDGTKRCIKCDRVIRSETQTQYIIQGTFIVLIILSVFLLFAGIGSHY